MSNNNLKSDLDLLDKTISYLNKLCPRLPLFRLQHHCVGAMASLFELFWFLKSQNLKNYANIEK